MGKGLSISKGNAKLGQFCPSFSLPSQKSCPGSSSYCREYCYTKKGPCRLFALKYWQKNLNLLKADMKNLLEIKDFLRYFRPRYFRIHVSGDFFSVKYIKAWHAIIKENPNTMFWAYTRSYKKPALLKALNELRKLPNLMLWASCDKGSKGPKDWPKVYMQIDKTDFPSYPVALIFRIDKLRGSIAKKINGIPVCPKDNGLARNKSLTCLRCGICFRKSLTQ